MKNREKLLWSFFFLVIVIIFFHLLGTFLKINFIHQRWFKLLLLGLPVVLLIFHSLLTLTTKRGLLFIFLASFIGWTMEIWGLKSGTFFGGYYVYHQNQLSIFNVPLSVVFYWAVFIYTGYCITNAFLFWLNKDKPSIKKHSLFYLLFTLLLDGWFVVAIDLFMDPLRNYLLVTIGSWTWLTKGSYFGVPFGNFIGWFIVTIIVSGLFRSYEYYFPLKEEKYNKSIFLIPVIGYGIMALSCFMSAIKYQMVELAILGALFMLPTVIINLILYIKWRLR